MRKPGESEKRFILPQNIHLGRMDRKKRKQRCRVKNRYTGYRNEDKTIYTRKLCEENWDMES